MIRLRFAFLLINLGATPLWAPAPFFLESPGYRYEGSGALWLSQGEERVSVAAASLGTEAPCRLDAVCGGDGHPLAALGPLKRIAVADRDGGDWTAEFAGVHFVPRGEQGVRVALSGNEGAGLGPLLESGAACRPILLLEGAEGQLWSFEATACSDPALNLGPGQVAFGPLVADEDGYESFAKVLLCPQPLAGGEAAPGWLTASSIVLGWDEGYPWVELTRPLQSGPDFMTLLETPPQALPGPPPAGDVVLRLHNARAAGHSTSPPTAAPPFETLLLDIDGYEPSLLPAEH